MPWTRYLNEVTPTGSPSEASGTGADSTFELYGAVFALEFEAFVNKTAAVPTPTTNTSSGSRVSGRT